MTDPGTPPRNAAPEVPDLKEVIIDVVNDHLANWGIVDSVQVGGEPLRLVLNRVASQIIADLTPPVLAALADAERRAARAEAQLDAARNKGLELASAVADARAAINREAP
jgi:hypothetical protein